MRTAEDVARPLGQGELLGLLEQLPVAASLIDLNGNQRFGNRAFRELFRLTHADLGRVGAFKLTAPDDRRNTLRYLRQLLLGEIDNFETVKRYRRLDGSEFAGRLHARLMRDDADRPVGFVGIIEDLTTQIEAEEAQRHAERRLRRILDAEPEPVCEFDLEGTITYCNPAYMTQYGGGQDLTGQNLYDLIPPEAIAEHEATVARLLHSPERTYMHERSYADGRVVEWSNTLAEDSNGVPLVVSVGRDVTERVRLAEALQATSDAVSERSRRRLALLNLTGQSLRTPLATVSDLTEMLSYIDVDPGLREIFSSLYRHVARVNRLVEDSLDYGRLDAGDLRLVPEHVNAHGLLLELGNRWRNEDPDNGLQIDIGDDLPPTWFVDPARIRQLLDRLVAGVMMLDPASPPRLEVRSLGDDDAPTMVVSLSLPADAIPFSERMCLLDIYTGRDAAVPPSGAAIGPAIVRMLAAAMHGSTGALSDDQELTMWVSIPVGEEWSVERSMDADDGAAPAGFGTASGIGLGAGALPTLPGDPTATLIDVGMLDQLGEAFGDSVEVRAAIERFVVDARSIAGDVEDALWNSDVERARAGLAHLRDGGGLLGATALAEACRSIEDRVEQFSIVHVLVEELDRSVDQTLSALCRWAAS